MCEIRFDNKHDEISSACGAYLTWDEVNELYALDPKYCPWCGQELEIVWPDKWDPDEDDRNALYRDYTRAVM